MPAGLSEENRDKIIGRILRAVKGGRTFFLSGHQKPDGDTIGSQIAFASLLRRLKKRVEIYNTEPVPQMLRFLPGSERIKTAKKVGGFFDVAVVFECSGPDRMGNIIDLDRQARTVINIDHHAHHNHFGDINLIDPRASSNSEQLFYVFRKAGLKLARAEAMALYVGLVTDTGRFQQENTNPRSHQVAAGLLAAGVPVAEISRRLYDARPMSSLKLLGRALDSLRLEEGGLVSLMALRRRDFAEVGAADEETEDIINYGLKVSSVEVALFLKETEEGGSIKVSFRGKGRVDLCRIAVGFGGGGHRNASGCTVSGTLEDVSRAVLSEVRKSLSR